MRRKSLIFTVLNSTACWEQTERIPVNSSLPGQAFNETVTLLRKRITSKTVCTWNEALYDCHTANRRFGQTTSFLPHANKKTTSVASRWYIRTDLITSLSPVTNNKGMRFCRRVHACCYWGCFVINPTCPLDTSPVVSGRHPASKKRPVPAKGRNVIGTALFRAG
jgi:hypothetical protein